LLAAFFQDSKEADGSDGEDCRRVAERVSSGIKDEFETGL
jgi:hypothetical protein